MCDNIYTFCSLPSLYAFCSLIMSGKYLEQYKATSSPREGEKKNLFTIQLKYFTIIFQ